jgi:uncharacterized coiled-coil DUF342 family protein
MELEVIVSLIAGITSLTVLLKYAIMRLRERLFRKGISLICLREEEKIYPYIKVLEARVERIEKALREPLSKDTAFSSMYSEIASLREQVNELSKKISPLTTIMS